MSGLTPDQLSLRNDLIDRLKNGLIYVTFTKKDGSIRHMKATLMEEHLPPFERKENVEVKKEIEPSRYVNVWDFENKGWRKIDILSLS